MPTAFDFVSRTSDFVKKNARSAVNATMSAIDQGRTELADQKMSANAAAMQTPIQAPEVTPPSNPAQDALNNEMLGRLMRPGRGRRKGQMVTSGGKYSGRTVDEIYGKLQKRGSGAGGGLRTGSLSEGSGIDWLKANRTSGKALARQEANVGATGDRFKTAPKKVARPAMTQAPAVVDTKPMNMRGATPVSPQATNPAPSSPTGLDISGVSKLYKNAEAAVNSPEYKQRQQDRSVAPFMQGAMSPQKPFSAPGQQSPKRTPEPAWGPIKQPDPKTVRWAEQMRQNVDSATTPKPGIADTFLNLPAPTPNIRPLSSQQQAIVQGKPPTQPVVTSPVVKAMSAPPPTLAQKAPMTTPQGSYDPSLQAMMDRRKQGVTGGQVWNAKAPAETPRPVIPTPPAGMARTPSYMTPPPAAAPVAGQRVAQVPSEKDAAARQENLKRVQAQMAARGTAIAKEQQAKRSYLNGR